MILDGEHLVDAVACDAVRRGGVVAVGFNAGELWPAEEGHEADRLADLDRYVALPAAQQSVPPGTVPVPCRAAQPDT